MSNPSASARRCPRCQKVVVAGVLCPECGLLEGAHHPPLGLVREECPLTDAERWRWRVWFWVMLGLGPVLAFALLSLVEAMNSGQLPGWQVFFVTNVELAIFGIMAASALGAAYFLIRSLVPRQSFLELVLLVLVCGAGLTFAEGLILFLITGLLGGARL